MVGEVMNHLIKQNLTSLRTKCENELEAIDKKLFASPHDDFFKVHDEFKKLLDSGVSRTTPEFIKKIEALSVREKKAKRAMLKRPNLDEQDKLNKRKVELHITIREIENMLWTDDFRNKLRQQD
jgi:hypothetical protein